MKLPAVLCSLSLATAAAANLRVIPAADPASGSAKAVVAPAQAALVFTEQVLPADAGDATAQIQSVLKQLDETLQQSGSSLAEAVRLHFYLVQPEVAAEIDKALAAAFSGTHKPAVTLVITPLPKAGTLVAADAVGLASKTLQTVGRSKVLPAGVRVFISGQAEKGDGTLADATRQTLLSLERTLVFLGLTKGDVVQVKSFLTPMSQWQDADREITTFFGTVAAVRAYVEWESTLPIEIELVVSGASNAALAQGPAFEIRTPPDMKHSPVYSRLAIVRNAPLIFTSSLFPTDPDATAEAQLRSLFSNLKRILDATGSDWSHLVKATYYVSDDAASAAHNAQRPDYYNPERPPAASKAKVKGVGPYAHGINLDMIAVPAE